MNKALKMLAGTQGKSIISMVKDLKKQAVDKKKSIMTGQNEVQKQIFDKQQEKSQKTSHTLRFQQKHYSEWQWVYQWY